jgi:hypothetical protein
MVVSSLRISPIGITCWPNFVLTSHELYKDILFSSRLLAKLGGQQVAFGQNVDGSRSQKSSVCRFARFRLSVHQTES